MTMVLGMMTKNYNDAGDDNEGAMMMMLMLMMVTVTMLMIFTIMKIMEIEISTTIIVIIISRSTQRAHTPAKVIRSLLISALMKEFLDLGHDPDHHKKLIASNLGKDGWNERWNERKRE